MRTRKDLYKNIQCGYLRQFYLTTAKASGLVVILFSWHIYIIELAMAVRYYEAKGIEIFIISTNSWQKPKITPTTP